MGAGTFLQQVKTKNELMETNRLLKEQNQLLREIKNILELKGGEAK